MGFLAPFAAAIGSTASGAAAAGASLLSTAGTALGIGGTAAAGAIPAGVGISGIGSAFTPAALGTAATGGATSALSSAAGSSFLGGLAKTAALTATTGLIGKALAPKPPTPSQPPKAPDISKGFSGNNPLINIGEGSANGTFLTGSNRTPNVGGARKTLLGQ